MRRMSGIVGLVVGLGVLATPVDAQSWRGDARFLVAGGVDAGRSAPTMHFGAERRVGISRFAVRLAGDYVSRDAASPDSLRRSTEMASAGLFATFDASTITRVQPYLLAGAAIQRRWSSALMYTLAAGPTILPIACPAASPDSPCDGAVTQVAVTTVPSAPLIQETNRTWTGAALVAGAGTTFRFRHTILFVEGRAAFSPTAPRASRSYLWSLPLTLGVRF